MAENERFLLQCLIITLLCIWATDSETNDPFSQQPRISVEDGHLILRSAFNRNVSFSAMGQGSIQVNNVNLGQIISSTQLGGSLQVSTVTTLQRRMTDILNQWSTISDLVAQVNQLEENITEISNKVNQFTGSGQDRISNRGLRRYIGKVNKLTDDVNHLTQLLTKNECNSNPCRNGGTCIDSYNGFICNCPSNWEGTTCETDVNECGVFAGTSFGCQNGATCTNLQGSYRCDCPSNWYGIHCNQQHDDCSSASHYELCGHGTCIDEKRVTPGQPKYRCICDPGWQKASNSPACTEDIDECLGPDRKCSQNPLVTCINLPGTFHCGPCPQGYTGDGRSCSDINECEFQNGGCSMQPYVQCINTVGSRNCGPCPAGYAGNGMQCIYQGICNINNGGCHPLATCIENTAITGTYRECRCRAGYVGSGEGLQGCVQSAGMSCANNPCQHGTCEMLGQSFHCICEAGYFGTLCDQAHDPCFSAPCLNGGTCVRTPGSSSYSCVCPNRYSGPTCAERRGCGGRLTSDNGTLTFPENGVHYDHLESCAWVITVSPTKVINITFDHFNLESGAHCEYDFLQLNDGPNAGSRVIGRFCDIDLQGHIFTTTHNSLYLWFSSDRTVAATGFSIRWTVVDPVCGGELDIAEYGAVNSPGYPGYYPKNRTCLWLVRVPMQKRIQFAFATLKLEHHENCSYDYLKIYDGDSESDPVLGTYCTTVTPAPITTSGHSAALLFHSDDSVQDYGFHITYLAVPKVVGCGGTLTAPQGTFKSPNFPEVYEHNLLCEWLIRIHPDNRLSLHFTEFHLETHNNCNFDSIEIYDGSSDSAPLIGRYCGDSAPPDLLSNSNQLYIKFRTDSSVQYGGFKVEYKTICGGIFSGLTGTIQSPYYPDRYPSSATCIYDIRLPVGYLVNFTIYNMDIEGHHSCRFDNLQVRDGDSAESSLLQQLCGNVPPESILSSYNSLWLKFVTDGSVENTGFYARYESIETGCGGIMAQSPGQISSPRHPDDYPHLSTCAWLIRAPPGHIIRITFTAFRLEESRSCQYDYVLVQEQDGTQLGRFCGAVRIPTLTSMDNVLIVKFVTDSSISREGFTATYEFLDGNEACGGAFFQESGVIRSPGFPNHYPHSAHCVWTLHGQNGRQITLNVTNFQLEAHDDCKFDYLEIRNGDHKTSPLVGKFCGDQITPSIRSHSNVLRLEFQTDISFTAPGFQIFYDSATTGCGGILKSPRGSIISPNYPQPYPYNADCMWFIQVSEGSVILLSIVEIDIEQHQDCLYDYLQVFDGSTESSRSLLRICNNQQNPGSIQSTGNSMLIRFRSDASQVAGGFQLSYQTICNNVLTKRRGVIESPNFPNTYPHNHNCSWIINAPPGNNISIAFSHFFMEGGEGETCESDYVEVIEYPTGKPEVQLGKYCGGSSLPSTILTSTNKATVRLITDQSVAREGFRLEYSMRGCGGDIRDKYSGFITSPNYPNGYPFSTTCYWHIWYPPGNRVEFRIVDFELEEEEDCTFDFLKVYGGEDQTSPLLVNLCHSINQTQTYTSHGNQIYVHFNSDISFSGKGFKAYYKKLPSGCGGKYTVEESTIMSPNFPNTYLATDDCEWLIEVSSSNLVTLEFYDFEIPLSENCTHGHVAVYDGDSSSAPLLLRHCGGKPEGIISATGNQMLVKLVADGVNVGKGFRAHYKTGCGRRLLADDGGEITSPNYPHFARSGNCSWIIYASEPGQTVMLTITHLSIPESANCTYSSLHVYDGDMADSPIMGEYCGHSLPPPILSRGSTLHLFMQNIGIFRGVYGITSKFCGGNFASPEGDFASPGYPFNYDMDMECVWTIEASIGSKVQISFQAFNLEDSEHCNTDYLEIHENDAAGRLIGKYCGNRIPSNVTAAYKLWLKFRSDDVGTAPGFLAHYEIQHGFQLNGTEGQIASPGYPHRYHKDERYEWTIYVPAGMFVSIRFLYLGIISVSRSYACVSFVAIYDGSSDASPSLGDFCGYQAPDPVVTTGNVATVVFIGRSYYPGSFHLAWSAVSETGIVVQEPAQPIGDVCFEEITLNSTDEFGFSSPNYPNNYPNNVNCTYIVRAPVSQHIEVTIDELELEGMPPDCPFDKLESYYLSDRNVNDWTLNTTLCGRKKDVLLMSQSNLLKFIFTTDPTLNIKGFHATAKSRCGGTLRGPVGVLRSSSIHPHLEQLTSRGTFRCEWTITVRPRRTIQLSFDNFNIEPEGSCNTNYLMIRNGGSPNSPLLGRHCGSTIPAAQESGSNEVYVQVVFSALTARPPIFDLRYSELSLGCGGHLYLNADTQYVEIASPNYPLPPSHDTECEWIIASPSGSRMRVDFESEFRMGPNCYSGDQIEYLELFDGGTEVADVLHRFCGHDQPSSVMTTGNALFVRYVTSVDEPQSGFKATVRTANCGGTISSFQSTIQSPNYPENYPSSQECEWFLKMKMGYNIVLNLTDLDTPTTENCSLTDFVEIRNYDAQGELLAQLCGSLRNSATIVINVPSPQAYVKFKSNSANTARGFRMNMDANFMEGCGGVVEGPSGVITSPKYPNPLTGSRECFWRINAPEGRRIRITFNEFNLPRDENSGICLSFLQVFNVTHWRSRRFSATKLCGNYIPDDIVSSTSVLNIVLVTRGLAAGEGFSLTYSTQEESICGGSLPLPRGEISTPNFTVQNDSYIDCKWRAFGENDNNRTVVFKFDVLDVPGIISNYCENGVLYFIGGQNLFMGSYCGNYSEPVIVTSPFASTTLRLIANLRTPFRGIRGTYNVSDCGGFLDGANATITSPGYPNNYLPGMDCQWVINVPEGEEIRLTTEDIQMEEDCKKDYVLVRTGFHATSSPILGKFCGSHLPAPIVSTGNTFVIRFHSDEVGSARGFKMTTKEIQRGCGGLIHNTQGNFTSPNYPSRYGNNVECKWTIEYVPGSLVGLEFLGRFDIEMDNGCNKDYLLIEDFVDNTWSFRDKKCGSATPSAIISKSSKMRITFRSNERITGDGFNIKYSATCGGNFTAKEDVVTSPDYPNFYQNDLSCTYVIGKPGHYVSLSFDDYFSLESHYSCMFDSIEIFQQEESNETTQGLFCGSIAPAPRTLRGPVIIRFKTDSSVVAHGFKINYEITDCGAILTEPTGYISTPKSVSEYTNQMDCTWQIIAQPNKVITLRFIYFELEQSHRCWSDYLEARDGNETAPTLGRFCAKRTPLIKSSGNMLTLRFHTDHRITSRGFSGFYYNTYGIAQGCGGTLNASSGEVSSLDANGDQMYEPNLDCGWIIIGEADKVLKLTFITMDIEESSNTSCSYDYVELRDDISTDGSLIGRYCGRILPTPIITSNNKATVFFHSDDQTNKPGFRLRYESVPSPCGPSTLITSPENQTFTSPNYPNPYPVNLRCRWTISRNMTTMQSAWFRHAVQVSFGDFDIPCGGDFLEFQTSKYYYGTSTSKRLCGPTHPHDVLSYSGLKIFLHSDSRNNGGRGFSITYRDADCNRVYVRDNGVIANPTYPGRFNSESRCIVTIQAALGKTISLYFKRYEMYASRQDQCNNTNLQIYDGNSSSAPLIRTYCDYDTPDPIFSNGSALYLDFKMQYKTALYYLTYTTTDQGRGCGGNFFVDEGAISSPLYPQSYKREGECKWYIAVPGYHTAKLEFQTFNLNSTSGCESNYLEIYEGHTDIMANRIARYCGNDSPGNINSRSNEILIKMVTNSQNSGIGFLLFFSSNSYVPDNSTLLIQRHSVSNEDQQHGDILYILD